MMRFAAYCGFHYWLQFELAAIPMMRFAAYYGFHYWLQFELAAYNISLNLARLVPV
jgi:hypothetical protein